MNERVRTFLIDLARQRTNQTISYQRLSDNCNLRLDMSNIADRNTLATILDDISTFEHVNHRPLLSALVIRLDDEREGDGFYKMADRLGYGSWQKLKRENIFEAEQIRDCTQFWSIDENYQLYR
jgi:hypothetical protein